MQEWLPTVPAVKAALEWGIDVADVGCGRGRAVINVVQAFPRSRIVGYDVYEPNIDRAMANAHAAGVAAQARFERLDASKAIPGQYDLITTFDVIHDAVDPRGLLRTIRRLCGQAGPTSAWTSTARTSRRRTGTAGLALLWIQYGVLHDDLAGQRRGGTGHRWVPRVQAPRVRPFSGVRQRTKLPLENPFNNLYEVTP